MMEPKIRLKGFSGVWGEKPLLDVVTLYNGLTYTPSDIRDRGTLVLRSSNVQEGEIALSNNVYVKSDVATSPNVEKGDIIVVVRNGSRALIGKHAQIKGEMPNTVIGAFMAGMHTDEPEFMNALLSTSSFDDEININLGATINQITNGTFRSMKFHFPKKDEQKALGAYFQHLDSLIQSTTKKIESLKQVKAASLQSLFPQEGETTPRVRFKGFEGEWEKVSLNDVGFMTAGGTPSTFNPEFWNGDINWLQSGAVQNSIITPAAVERTITYKGLNQSSAYLIRKDSVLIAITGATCANIGYLPFESTANQSVVSIETYDKYNSVFIYQNLLTQRNQILSFKGGSAQSGVSLGSLKKVSLLVPSNINEQKAIGNYFTNLDSQITLQTQRLDKLKQIKSACLDNMFV